jgi:hypothetical protein
MSFARRAELVNSEPLGPGGLRGHVLVAFEREIDRVRQVTKEQLHRVPVAAGNAWARRRAFTSRKPPISPLMTTYRPGPSAGHPATGKASS